jgi:hypothetical protein
MLSIRRICNVIHKNELLAEIHNSGANMKMLIKDVADGIGRTMMPWQLWESRVDYQAFPYELFCKRVYEVRQKGLAGPYWQLKRNKHGRELHSLETYEMRKTWALEMEEVTGMFKQGSIDNDLGM